MATARRNQFTQLGAESLSELAYRAIRDAIVEGRLAQGEKLVEAQLAAELGVSRAPIREALGRLVHDGLLVERPRHGVAVRTLTAEDFVDLYNLRLAIERAAVRLVVRSGQNLAGLEAAIEDMRRTAGDGDVAGTAAAELRFHELLCRKSGNAYLADAFTRLRAQIQMALTLDDSAYEDLGEVAREHEPVVEALRSGDERQAVRRIEEHILLTVDGPLARLGGRREDLLDPLH